MLPEGRTPETHRRLSIAARRMSLSVEPVQKPPETFERNWASLRGHGECRLQLHDANSEAAAAAGVEQGEGSGAAHTPPAVWSSTALCKVLLAAEGTGLRIVAEGSTPSASGLGLPSARIFFFVEVEGTLADVEVLGEMAYGCTMEVGGQGGGGGGGGGVQLVHELKVQCKSASTDAAEIFITHLMERLYQMGLVVASSAAASAGSPTAMAADSAGSDKVGDSTGGNSTASPASMPAPTTQTLSPRPAGLASARLNADVASSDGDGNLWTPMLDEDSGYTYYWNNSTGATTWELPEGARMTSETAAKAGSTHQQRGSDEDLPQDFFELSDDDN